MLRPIACLARSSIRTVATAAVPAGSSSTRYSALGQRAAEEVTKLWKGTTADGGQTKMYINGRFVDSTTSSWLDVRDPVCEAPRHGAMLMHRSPLKRWSTRYRKRLRQSSIPR